MKNKYIFPALFEKGAKKGYLVTFPDFDGCITEGNNIEEALLMANEALSLHLYAMEKDEESIPAPTNPEKITVAHGSFLSMVEVWMPPIREEMDNKAVKKTLTLPKWLNDMAENKKVNFSHLLQTALKDFLGIDHK